jgi:hypothetical protein
MEHEAPMNTRHRCMTASVWIAATPMAIFDVLTDLERWHALDDALIDVSPRDALALGSEGTITRRVARANVTTAWAIVEFERGSRFTIRDVGRGYQLDERVELAPAGDGTNVDIQDDLRATSLIGRLMVPFSAGIVQRDLVARTGRLKRVVEDPGASAQAIGQ